MTDRQKIALLTLALVALMLTGFSLALLAATGRL